jgi:hypothetical protein
MKERGGFDIRVPEETSVEADGKRQLPIEISHGNRFGLHRPLAKTSSVAALGIRGTATFGLERISSQAAPIVRGLPMLAARTPGLLFHGSTVIPDFGHTRKRAGQNPNDCQEYVRRTKHNSITSI